MNKQEIEQWLRKHNVRKYVIHPNFVVDIKGSINICDKKLTSLPFQFGNVTGFFDCSHNQLTSLQHCPYSVGRFYCSHNQLTSLQYYPLKIHGEFHCHHNPFVVTEENKSVWMETIKNHKQVYWCIEEPTKELTCCYKMLYEV